MAPTAHSNIFTALFSPNASVNSGAASISMADGSFTDSSGPPGVGDTVSLTYNTLAPTVTIASSANRMAPKGR